MLLSCLEKVKFETYIDFTVLCLNLKKKNQMETYTLRHTMRMHNRRLYIFTKSLFGLHMDLVREEVNKRICTRFYLVPSINLLRASRCSLPGNCKVENDSFPVEKCRIVCWFQQTSVSSAYSAEEIQNRSCNWLKLFRR